MRSSNSFFEWVILTYGPSNDLRECFDPCIRQIIDLIKKQVRDVENNKKPEIKAS